MQGMGSYLIPPMLVYYDESTINDLQKINETEERVLIYSCYCCNYQGRSENKVLVHSVKTHTG